MKRREFIATLGASSAVSAAAVDQEGRPPSKPPLRPLSVTLLGTGTPAPSLERQSSGYLIEIGTDLLVWDHGT